MVRTLSYWMIAAAVGASMLACGGNDSSPSSDSPDAGFAPSDTGVDDPDAGFVDAAVLNCSDPVNGTGCVDGQSCVFRPTPTEVVQCRDLGAASALGEVCSLLDPGCQLGATCVISEDGDDPRCRQTCRPAMQNADCAPLMGDNTCVTLAQTSGTYGFCLPFTSCDPLQPDSCPMNENCSAVGSDALGCTATGPVTVSGDCSTNACARGLLCLNLGEGAQCYEPCSATVTCDNAARPNCQGLTNRNFGVCLPAGQSCNALNDMCPPSDRCTLIGNGQAECRPAGTVPRGGICAMESCARGSVCINVNNVTQCLQPCDGNTTCAMGTCQGNVTGYDFGICL